MGGESTIDRRSAPSESTENSEARLFDIEEMKPVSSVSDQSSDAKTVSEWRQLISAAANHDFAPVLPPLILFDNALKTIEQKLGGEQSLKTPLCPSSSMTSDALLKLSCSAFKNPSSEKDFRQNLETFERRADAANMPANQRQSFYAQIGRMLENANNGGNKRFSQNGMLALASDTMKHAATPGTVDQGAYPTCSVAALETALYKQEPGTIAKLVADVSISGSYKTIDGTLITPPARNLKPDKYNHDSEEQKRSSANQLAQVSLLNVHWNRQDSLAEDETGKKGKIYYEEGYPKDNLGDAQVRLIDHSATPPQPFTRTVSYIDPIAMESGRPIAAGIEEIPIDFPAMSVAKTKDIYTQLRGNQGNIGFVSLESNSSVQSPKTLEEFKQIFDKAAESGTLKAPIVLGINANIQPFRADMTKSNKQNLSEAEQKEEEEKFARMHAHHAVTAVGYNPKTGMVSIENTWGESKDHTGEPGARSQIHISQLFKSYKNMSDASKPPTKETESSPPAKKEKLSDLYIEMQGKLVAELAKDDAVSPDKLVKERSTLLRYVSHWKGEEAARPVVAELAKDMKALASSSAPGYLKQFDVIRANISVITKAGMNEGAKDILAALDKRFSDQTTEIGALHVANSAMELAKLHAELGDEAAGDRIVQSLVQVLDKGRNSNNSDSWKWTASTVLAIDTLKEAGFTAASKQMIDQLAVETSKIEKVHGPDARETLEAKMRLLEVMSVPEGKDNKKQNTLVAEIETSYNKLKAADNCPFATLNSLASILRDHYVATKNTAALDKIIKETIDRIQKGLESEDPDSKPGSGAFNKDLVGPLMRNAAAYSDAGISDKAITMMERAYTIAKKQDDDFSQQRAARRLAEFYRAAGRENDALTVETESGLTGRFKGRRD